MSQRRALTDRDQGCRFPGCGARGSLHAHHIHEYRNGGLTTTMNLILLCPMHHHAVHRHNWTISGNPNSTLTFTKPGKPPTPKYTGDIETLIQLVTGPITPLMRGEPFDINLAVEALLHNQTIHPNRNEQNGTPKPPTSPAD